MSSRIVHSQIDSLFCDLLNKLRIEGSLTSPRGEKTRELNNISFTLTDPNYSIISNPARKISLKYLAAELLWYFSGSLEAKGIEDYASIWKNIKDRHGKLNSNYGYFVFHQRQALDWSQFDWVYNSLKNDINSRQAVINFNQPMHKDPNTKDFPCTISMQFYIRDNKLHAITNMRSQDAIYGMTYDFPFFCIVMMLLYGVLKDVYPDLLLGTYNHSVASFHVYERHFKMMDEIVANDIPYQLSSLSDMEFNVNDCELILQDIADRYEDPQSDFIRNLLIMRGLL